MQELNKNPSQFRFNLAYSATVPSLGSSQSQIWIENINYPGIASYSWNGSCNLTKVKIRLDSSVNWTTSQAKNTMSSYGGNARPMQTTLLHELGHAIGLGHEADEYNIMGQDWNHVHTNGSHAHSYFGEDANDGAVALYGSDGTQDLGVVHWKWSRASGEYSAHERTKIYNPVTGLEMPYSTVNDERVYKVNRGQQVRLELTYENNGNDFQSEDVGYYVSANNFISTEDRLLTTQNLNLSPDNVATYSKLVTVPSNLACNKNYWLGAVIDKNNSLSEFDEHNNASYIPIKTNWNWNCLVALPLAELSPVAFP